MNYLSQLNFTDISSKTFYLVFPILLLFPNQFMVCEYWCVSFKQLLLMRRSFNTKWHLFWFTLSISFKKMKILTVKFQVLYHSIDWVIGVGGSWAGKIPESSHPLAWHCHCKRVEEQIQSSCTSSMRRRQK